MPKPKPLLPHTARRSLAHRFAGTPEKPGLADRLRQINTRFGIRSKRVFLLWTKFTGKERGEGDEQVVARIEILPTPKVADLTAVALNPFSAGRYPVGAIRVTEISAGRFTLDQLMGTKIPNREDPLTEPYDFFYEIVEDGRGDSEPIHQRYRILSQPDRREGFVYWTLLLERTAEDFSRQGQSQIGTDPPVGHLGR